MSVLPWKTLEDREDPHLAVYVSNRLGEILGDDEEAWTAFSVLSAGFPGTVSEIVEIALTL